MHAKRHAEAADRFRQKMALGHGAAEASGMKGSAPVGVARNIGRRENDAIVWERSKDAVREARKQK